MLESKVRITSTFQADRGHKDEILSEPIGAGAQGVGQPGRRHTDDRPVAIKRITDGVGRGPEANRELQAALKLHPQGSRHPLVPLSCAIDDADPLWVTPLANHRLSAELASQENALAEGAFLPVLQDITSGLVEPHAAGVGHGS